MDFVRMMMIAAMVGPLAGCATASDEAARPAEMPHPVHGTWEGQTMMQGTPYEPPPRRERFESMHSTTTRSEALAHTSPAPPRVRPGPTPRPR